MDRSLYIWVQSKMMKKKEGREGGPGVRGGRVDELQMSIPSTGVHARILRCKVYSTLREKRNKKKFFLRMNSNVEGKKKIWTKRIMMS